MFKVYRVFLENGKLNEYYWGQWADENKANEVALELRDGNCFSTIVREE